MKLPKRLQERLRKAIQRLSACEGDVAVTQECQWCGELNTERFLDIPQDQTKFCKCFLCNKWVRMTRCGRSK